MVKKIGGRTYFGTAEACRKAGISRSTFFRWIKDGVLRDTEIKDRNGWRLFSEKDIAAIRAEAIRINQEEK
ncbi:MerR family transcriptional regulator [Chloroflexota bacterium]